jgi:adenine deaminase
MMGTRKMVSLTSLLLIASTLGWGVRVQSPTAPYWELMTLAFLALSVIPELKITDMGYVDVTRFELVDVLVR